MPQADQGPSFHPVTASGPTGSLDALEPLFVRDLSPGGVLIEYPTPLDVGSVHEFELIGGTTSVRVRAAVTHVSPLRLSTAERYFLVELAFLDLNARSSAVISGWLNERPAEPSNKGA